MQGIEGSAPVEALETALQQTSKQFERIAMVGPSPMDDGTTALVAMLIERHLVVGNIGDSRAVLCRRVRINQ